jgi:hypothetical protein
MILSMFVIMQGLGNGRTARRAAAVLKGTMMIRERRSLFVAAILAASMLTVQGNRLVAAGRPADPSETPTIGIGRGESDAHTHLSFGESVPKDAKIIEVSTHLIVDEASPNGLNFFAIQVNFPNKTWAHGGPQLVKKGGKPFQQANWGGLVNRGGGSKDYQEVDWKKDLLLIQCGIDKPNTVPWQWQAHREYLLSVKRGKQIQLPAEKVKIGSKDVEAPARTMWEWHFAIEPVKTEEKAGKSEPAFTSLLYDSADSIRSFYLWNESGYGSKSDEQHSRWSPPHYRTIDDKNKVAEKWKRF